MDNYNTRILLICREGVARQKYMVESKGLGAQIDVVSSFDEFTKAVTDTPYNGLMFDMFTKIRVLKGVIEKVNDILQMFPVIQLTFDERSGEIRASYSGMFRGIGTINDFILNKCSSFGARTIRFVRREAINLNVTLLKDNNISSAGQKRAVTMNVSQGGCFIVSFDDWQVNGDIWFMVTELEDHAPIRGKIVWCAGWGKKMCVPGIGIQFQDIKVSQFENFCAVCRI